MVEKNNDKRMENVNFDKLKEKGIQFDWKQNEWINLERFCDNFGFSKYSFFDMFNKYKKENGWKWLNIVGVLYIEKDSFIELYNRRVDKAKNGLEPLWLLMK